MPALDATSSDLLKRINELEPAQAKALVTQAQKDVYPDSDAAKVRLWRYLLVGVFIIGSLSVLGAIGLAVAKLDATAAWVLATAVVTGTIGLFAKSPTS